MDNPIPRQKLKEALDYYLDQVWQINNREDCERMFAGILAFIAVDARRDSYLPLNIDVCAEKKKHWWEFWK